MEYPIDEQSQYPLIKNCLEKVFASRVKPISEKIIELWITEILNRRFTDDAIKKATKMFIEDESYTLSLPIFIRLITENMTYDTSHNATCVFCGGVGRVGATLAFDLEGNWIDEAPYMLNCYCNKDKKLLQMVPNEKTYNKTYAKGMYFRVFKDVAKQEEYLKKVRANGDKDILK